MFTTLVLLLLCSFCEEIVVKVQILCKLNLSVCRYVCICTLLTYKNYSLRTIQTLLYAVFVQNFRWFISCRHETDRGSKLSHGRHIATRFYSLHKYCLSKGVNVLYDLIKQEYINSYAVNNHVHGTNANLS